MSSLQHCNSFQIQSPLENSCHGKKDQTKIFLVKSKGTKEKNKNSLTEGLIVGAMGSISRGVSVKTRDSSRLSPGSPDSDLV